MLSPADIAFIKPMTLEESGSYKCCLQCMGACQRDVCIIGVCCGCGYFKKINEGHGLLDQSLLL